MKTAPTLIHAMALAACFLAHLAFAPEFAGVSRAIRTIAAADKASTAGEGVALPAIL